jgi:hypothetical protein
MRCRLLLTALLALAAALAPAGVRAQAVRVTVTDEATGAPVPGALVRLANEAGELARAGFSDARGTLLLRPREGGRYVLSAERSGYLRATTDVTVPERGEVRDTLRMRASPLGLDTVRVVVAADGPEVGRHTFERRRASGRGIYLDSAYVAQARALWPGDLLESVPGIEVRTAHGRQGYRLPTTRMGGRCLNSLVNGLPFYGGWPRWMVLEETLRRRNVVAVEVYRVFDEVPRELQRFARNPRPCGLVVYWTQDGWQSRSRGDGSGRP